MPQQVSKHVKKPVKAVQYAVAISKSVGPAALIAFTIDSENKRDGMVISGPRKIGLGYSIKLNQLPQHLTVPVAAGDVDPAQVVVYQDEKPVQLVGKTIDIEPISVAYESSNFILDDIDRLFLFDAADQKGLSSKEDLTVAFDSLAGTEEIEVRGQKVSEIATYEGAKQTVAVLQKSFEEALRHLNFFAQNFEQLNFADDKQAVRFFWDYETNNLVLETEGKVNGVCIEELTDLIYVEIFEGVKKAIDRHDLEVERQRITARLQTIQAELSDLED